MIFRVTDAFRSLVGALAKNPVEKYQLLILVEFLIGKVQRSKNRFRSLFENSSKNKKFKILIVEVTGKKSGQKITTFDLRRIFFNSLRHAKGKILV